MRVLSVSHRAPAGPPVPPGQVAGGDRRDGANANPVDAAADGAATGGLAPAEAAQDQTLIRRAALPRDVPPVAIRVRPIKPTDDEDARRTEARIIGLV
jgi:hypothetical protein